MMLAGEVLPWREGNRFHLLVDGPNFFPAMLDALAKAERTIDLELYLVEDGRCLDRLLSVLLAAAERRVRIRCLFDGFGCFKLGQRNRERLASAGIEVRLYNPLELRLRFRNLHRDHRKIVLIDSETVFIGGTGVTDDFWDPDNPRQHWHEVMVKASGPVVQDWQRLFDSQWASCLTRRRIWHLPQPSRAPRIPLRPEASQGMGRVAYAAARQHSDVLHSLLRKLHRAEQRIWLATPYFLPTGKVRRALIRAARRGVDVQLLLTSRNTDHPPVRYAGQRFYPRLLRAGVRIHEYRPHFLHMKMVMVDDWVSVGSCNFDHWNLRWNLEANLEAIDPALTEEVTRCFQQDFDESREVTLRRWYARPLHVRLYQRMWGWLDRLLVNIFNRGG